MTVGAARVRHFVAQKMQEHAKSHHDGLFWVHFILNDAV